MPAAPIVRCIAAVLHSTAVMLMVILIGWKEGGAREVIHQVILVVFFAELVPDLNHEQLQLLAEIFDRLRLVHSDLCHTLDFQLPHF